MKGKVYRYVTETELDYMKNQPYRLGAYFGLGNSNTFIYKRKTKYLHFFKNRDSVALVRRIYKGKIDEKFYICTFEIPFSKLVFHGGLGYYGQYNTCWTKAVEFAIPAREFDPSWLVNVEEDGIVQGERHEI